MIDGALVAEDVLVAMPATGRQEGPGSYPAHLGARTAAGGATNDKDGATQNEDRQITDSPWLQL